MGVSAMGRHRERCPREGMIAMVGDRRRPLGRGVRRCGAIVATAVGMDRKYVRLPTATALTVAAVVRPVTEADKRLLLTQWRPVLNRGPAEWLDREWEWADLDHADQLACTNNAQWVVVASHDDAELFGVLVVSGPVPLSEMVPGTDQRRFLWVEYLAISPTIRGDCPSNQVREVRVKAVGKLMMTVAIELSVASGADGRVGLHAEGSVAIASYRRWNMSELDTKARHPTGDDLYTIFIGDESWAAAFQVDDGERPKGGSR